MPPLRDASDLYAHSPANRVLPRWASGAKGQKVDPLVDRWHLMSMSNASQAALSPVSVVTVGLAKARADAHWRKHHRTTLWQGNMWQGNMWQRKWASGTFLVALLALASTQIACVQPEEPSDALTEILRATLAKDRDALWDRLSPSSQRLLERISAEDAVFANGSRRPAKERLLDDGLDLAVGFSDVRQVARNGDDALLVATDHRGKKTEVHVRLVGDIWRLQLPGDDPAAAPDPFAQARRDFAAKARR